MIFCSILKCLSAVQQEDRKKGKEKKAYSLSFKTALTEIYIFNYFWFYNNKPTLNISITANHSFFEAEFQQTPALKIIRQSRDRGGVD